MTPSSPKSFSKIYVITVLASCFALWLGSYAYLRITHRVIHRSTYCFGEYASHSVQLGDHGIGLPSNSTFGLYYLTYPLMKLEEGMWHIIQPIGSKYP